MAQTDAARYARFRRRVAIGSAPRRPTAIYCHGFSADGRYYVYVAPGYRLFVDVERFLAGAK